MFTHWVIVSIAARFVSDKWDELSSIYSEVCSWMLLCLDFVVPFANFFTLQKKGTDAGYNDLTWQCYKMGLPTSSAKCVQWDSPSIQALPLPVTKPRPCIRGVSAFINANWFLVKIKYIFCHLQSSQSLTSHTNVPLLPITIHKWNVKKNMFTCFCVCVCVIFVIVY